MDKNEFYTLNIQHLEREIERIHTDIMNLPKISQEQYIKTIEYLLMEKKNILDKIKAIEYQYNNDFNNKNTDTENNENSFDKFGPHYT